MALLQFALVFGNDHFVLPVPMPVGAVFTTSHLLTFGMTLSLAPRLTYRLTGTTEAIGINHENSTSPRPRQQGQQGQPRPIFASMVRLEDGAALLTCGEVFGTVLNGTLAVRSGIAGRTCRG